ncbi:MAG: MarR family transcriptional regulator [Gemmatimonadota bacterium]|nr:MAG: MarR family transcriptional regulator [Gemmatimonadota bacterium]
MIEELKEMRDVAVEDFGKAYNNWGLSKLKGRIVGLLLFNQMPLSLDDIANELHVTKGSVSTVARQLEEGGLIRKVWVKGDRKDYYEIVSDVFSTTSEHNLKLLKDNLLIAQKYKNFLSRILDSASPEDKLELEVYLDRMTEMQEFYAMLVDTFERFITEWKGKFEVAMQ